MSVNNSHCSKFNFYFSSILGALLRKEKDSYIIPKEIGQEKEMTAKLIYKFSDSCVACFCDVHMDFMDGYDRSFCMYMNLMYGVHQYCTCERENVVSFYVQL